RLTASGRRRKDHRGLRASSDDRQRDNDARGDSERPAAPLQVTVTRVNFRLPTFSRYTPGGSFAFGSDTLSPSTLTPPCAISLRASDPDAARPSCASVFARGMVSAPASRET